MISVVVPYYENPTMFQIQQENWEQFSNAQFVVVDDGSQNYPAVNYVDSKLPIDIYYIHRDVPWGQHAARNLGMAKTQTEWNLLTDIDHLIEPQYFDYLLSMRKSSKKFYMFSRKNCDNSVYKYHPNSFLLTYSQFWSVDGYDERFVGTYGGDGMFRKNMEKKFNCHHLNHIYLTRYSRNDVGDASTTEYGRHGYYKDLFQKRKDDIKEGKIPYQKPLQFEWSKVW